VKPEINAICTILLAVAAVGILAASRLASRRERGREEAARLTAKL
jgi:putrescine transport system permease protein